MSLPSDASLHEQVQYLLDRQAILDCLNRYVMGVDRQDTALLLSAFHPDAVNEHGPYRGGPEGFVAWVNAFHQGFVAHTHNITSHSCEIDGTTAHAQTYALYGLRRRAGQEDGAIIPFGSVRYVDRLEKREGHWRIQMRKVVMEWRGLLPSNIPADYPFGSRDRSDPSYERPLQPSRAN